MSTVIEEKSGRRRHTGTGQFTRKPQPEAPTGLSASPPRELAAMAIFEAEDTHYRGVVDDSRVAAEVTRLVKLALRQGRDPAEAGAWLRELGRDAASANPA